MQQAVHRTLFKHLKPETLRDWLNIAMAQTQESVFRDFLMA